MGPKTTKRLAALGITTVGELAAADAETLTATFGPSTGLWILLLAKGGGDDTVSSQPWVPRSRSHAVTFPTDLTDRDEIDAAVTELTRRTLEEVVADGRVVTRVAVTVRTSTFYTRTKIRKLAAPSTETAVICRTALAVLDQFDLGGRCASSASSWNCSRPPNRSAGSRSRRRRGRPTRTGTPRSW